VSFVSPFPLAEFRNASERVLSPYEETKAAWWALLLQAPRLEVPIRVTSYIRTTGGVHTTGGGLDVVPSGITIKELAEGLARRHLVQFGGDGRLVQVIDETTAPGGGHVHLADRLVPGAVAGYLRGPVDGSPEYPAVNLAPLPSESFPPSVLALGAVAVIGAFLILR